MTSKENKDNIKVVVIDKIYSSIVDNLLFVLTTKYVILRFKEVSKKEQP
jgi:hypothetical protein